MVESIGICETHELPLDRNGECEMCRMSLAPSKAPPSSSAWWALIIPLLLLGAGIAWILSSFGTEPEAAPQRGVRGAEPRPADVASVAPEHTEPGRKPEIEPPAGQAPAPDYDRPTGEIPLPQPASNP
jgi:hypothetical protein